MPYRFLNIWTVVLGIAGLIVVALMVMFGADLLKASRSGPRWKRTLVTASLAVLAAVGVNSSAPEVSAKPPPEVIQQLKPRVSCYLMVHRPDKPLVGATLPARMAALKKLGVMEKIKSDVLKKLADQIRSEIPAYEKLVGSKTPAGSKLRPKTNQTLYDARTWVAAADMRLAVGDKPLADVPVWRTLTTNWRNAEEAASGRKGPYPFDKKTKKQLLAALDAAPGQLDALATAGYLTSAEAGLLKGGLEGLDERVKRKRPTELRNATCYKPMMIANRDPLIAMLVRMPLLEKIAKESKLHPAAVKRIVEVVDIQTAKLSDKKYLKGLTPESRKTAGNVVSAARAAVKKLNDAVAPKPAVTRD
jgi:hypothetical protein